MGDSVDFTDLNRSIPIPCPGFTLEVNPITGRGWFEHDRLGDECGGSITILGGEVDDYDGVYALPRPVVAALRKVGYVVPAACTWDEE